MTTLHIEHPVQPISRPWSSGVMLGSHRRHDAGAVLDELARPVDDAHVRGRSSSTSADADEAEAFLHGSSAT